MKIKTWMMLLFVVVVLLVLSTLLITRRMGDLTFYIINPNMEHQQFKVFIKDEILFDGDISECVCQKVKVKYNTEGLIFFLNTGIKSPGPYVSSPLDCEFVVYMGNKVEWWNIVHR